MSFPSPADDYSENRLRLDDLIVHREATFLVHHSGLSMEPTIHDGDVLIIDRALIPRDNQVVMVRLREKFMIRRLMAYDDGCTLLIADNPAFIIIEVFDGEEDFAIWGVVTYAIHKITALATKIRYETQG
jgi:DNA polymerase V